MLRCARVFGCVAIRRIVAAAGRAAFLTDAQVNPFRTDFHALFALVAFGVFDNSNLSDVSTAIGSH
jgi:hypothetical protein